MLNESSKILIEFIEKSFLAELVKEELITDISYNGLSIFYQHNDIGRQKSSLEITSEQVHDFLRHIANLGEKQFSYANPLLDLSFGRYRLNAVHYSLGRYANNKTSTFSLRLSSKKPRITLDGSFMPKEVGRLMEILIKNKQSIVIGGPTGSGKTELQKFLLHLLPKQSRVIIIDNVQELTYASDNDHLDITSWLVSEHIVSGSFQELIRNALRSHPDWLIIAESRGREMLDVLNSVMTGHPIITTIHARSVENIPNRMVRMVLMNGQETKYDEALQDILDHFRYFLYLNKSVDKDGRIMRFVQTIAEFDSNTQKLITVYDLTKPKEEIAQLTTYTKALIEKENVVEEIASLFKI